MAANTHILWAATALAALAGFSAMVILPGVFRRRQEDAARRQIALTDALDAAIGPIVAPVVTKAIFGPWRVEVAVPLGHPLMVGRLLEVTHGSLSAGGLDAGAYRILLVPRPESDRPAPRPRGRWASHPLSA